jgi:hypothetical protein
MRRSRSSYLLVEAAGVAGDGDVGGDCVAGAVGSQVGAGEDRGAHGVDAAGHDVLESQDDLGADDEGVDDQVRC